MRELSVHVGEVPGLAKFPAPFGILENEINAPLPISLRRTEEELGVTTFSLELNRKAPRGCRRANTDDRKIINRHQPTLREKLVSKQHTSFRPRNIFYSCKHDAQANGGWRTF